MPGNAPWPDAHKDLLRRAILEKHMPVKDLLRLFPGRTETAIRCQIRALGMSCVSEAQEPDMVFFEDYPTPQRG